MYNVYAIHNKVNDKIYIGYTENLVERLKRHNGELPTKSKSYTSKNKSSGTWKLIFTEHYNNRQEAVKKEKELKSYQGRKFIRSFINIKPLAQLVDPPAGGHLS